MKLMKVRIIAASLLMALHMSFGAAAKQPGSLSYLEATPVGSWQLREDINTDHKGRQTVNSVRTSMVASEQRDGERHYWVEMVIDAYKLKKNGKRKKIGEQTVVKSLMSETALTSDPANAIANLRGLGKEIIMQNGDEDPLIIRGAGGIAGAMMQSLGTEVTFEFEEQGSETVAVAAGEFEARKLHGKGSAESKIMFSKIKVESDTVLWFSGEVPFGIVRSEGTSVINGKDNSHTMELLEFGTEGAVSLITKTPQELPSIPGLFNQ